MGIDAAEIVYRLVPQSNHGGFKFNSSLDIQNLLEKSKKQFQRRKVPFYMIHSLLSYFKSNFPLIISML